MSYNRKTWQNRNSEHPYRRTLTDTTTGTSQTVDVTRAEGEVTTEGDAFDANNMNNMEGRIADEFSLINQKIGDLTQLDTEAKNSLVEAINEVAESGGGGGSSTLAGLTDTNIVNQTNGQILKWDSMILKWVNANASGGADVSPVIFHLTTSEYFEDATSASDWTLALQNLDGTGILDADAKARIEAGAPMYATFTYKSKDSDQPYDWGLYFPMQIFEENTLALRANDSFILLTPDESENYLGYYTALFEYSNDAYGLSSWLDNGRQFPSSDLINLAAIPYDNTNSGLSAVTAQYAIDEVATAVGGKADTVSPAFTGTPTAPTPTAGDDSTKIATTAFVQGEKPSVGSITNLTTVSANSSGWQNVGSVNTAKESKYLIVITAEFAGNSTGVRQIGISTTSGGAPMDFFRTVSAINMGTVKQQLQLVSILAPSSNTTYYINVAQNSGSGLEIKSKYSLIKLA